jgi:hypothetical protein
MRKSRFTETQIVAVRKRQNARGLEVSDLRRLRELEDEDRRLKTIVAEATSRNYHLGVQSCWESAETSAAIAVWLRREHLEVRIQRGLIRLRRNQLRLWRLVQIQGSAT